MVSPFLQPFLLYHSHGDWAHIFHDLDTRSRATHHAWGNCKHALGRLFHHSGFANVAQGIWILETYVNTVRYDLLKARNFIKTFAPHPMSMYYDSRIETGILVHHILGLVGFDPLVITSSAGLLPPHDPSWWLENARPQVLAATDQGGHVIFSEDTIRCLDDIYESVQDQKEMASMHDRTDETRHKMEYRCADTIVEAIREILGIQQNESILSNMIAHTNTLRNELLEAQLRDNSHCRSQARV